MNARPDAGVVHRRHRRRRYCTRHRTRHRRRRRRRRRHRHRPAPPVVHRAGAHPAAAPAPALPTRRRPPPSTPKVGGTTTTDPDEDVPLVRAAQLKAASKKSETAPAASAADGAASPLDEASDNLALPSAASPALHRTTTSPLNSPCTSAPPPCTVAGCRCREAVAAADAVASAAACRSRRDGRRRRRAGRQAAATPSAESSSLRDDLNDAGTKEPRPAEIRRSGEPRTAMRRSRRRPRATISPTCIAPSSRQRLSQPPLAGPDVEPADGLTPFPSSPAIGAACGGADAAARLEDGWTRRKQCAFYNP